MSDSRPVRPARAHPLLAIAAVAVVLFCGVGTAAILGWLPASTGSTHDSAPAPEAAGAPPPWAQPLSGSQPPPKADPAPQPQPTQRHAVCASCGTIESVREISTRAEGSGAGAVGGAVLGGLLGNQVGSGHGRQLATVAGAIGGAVAGNQIEDSMRARHTYAVTVRLDNGATRVLHLSARPDWQSGDRVRIVGGTLRAEG